MAKTVFQMMALIAVVLLTGQIRIQNQTVGARFQEAVFNGLEWTQEMARLGMDKAGFQARDDKEEDFDDFKPAARKNDKKKNKPVSLTPPPERDFEERITQADKESLLKILAEEK